jgi:hypothetical protein
MLSKIIEFYNCYNTLKGIVPLRNKTMSEITMKTYQLIKDQYIISIEKEKNFRNLQISANERLNRCIYMNINKNCSDYMYIKNRAHFITKLHKKTINELLYIKSKWDIVRMCTIKQNTENIEHAPNTKKKVKICTEMNQIHVFTDIMHSFEEL